MIPVPLGDLNSPTALVAGDADLQIGGTGGCGVRVRGSGPGFHVVAVPHSRHIPAALFATGKVSDHSRIQTFRGIIALTRRERRSILMAR
jgi:hypothetical protein